MVTTYTEGEAVITAKCDGYIGTCHITVYKTKVSFMTNTMNCTKDSIGKQFTIEFQSNAADVHALVSRNIIRIDAINYTQKNAVECSVGTIVYTVLAKGEASIRLWSLNYEYDFVETFFTVYCDYVKSEDDYDDD